ncbi:MAG: hypothetical protein Q9220_000487 [cf. Caloplaca sp. 1 TL-2023]
MASHHSNLGQEAWPLDPPGPAQHEYLKRFNFAKLQEWKARMTEENVQGEQARVGDQQLNDNLAKEEAAYQQHFASAYTAWLKLPPEKKQEEWRLECQKAYAEEYDRHQDARDRLDQLEQEIVYLRGQLDPSKNDQTSLSFLPSPPIPISRTTSAALSSQQARDLHHWDYDRLLEKWKQRVQQQRSTQHPLPNMTSWSSNDRSINGASPAYGEHPPGEPQHYHDDGDNEMEDEDLADAPGEDEDEDMALRAPPNDALDPNLRHGNGHLDVGGKMLMQLVQASNGQGGAER